MNNSAQNTIVATNIYLNVGEKYFGIYNKKNKYNLLRMDKKEVFY